ncbi:MAG: cytochrome c family protein [Desulfobacteraceae bacterium]|jgi:hypothetical protein|nr:cytochrome c family protein [Desulfobacteraceae bacterium]
MTAQKEWKPVFTAAVVLLVVGIFCYAAFSAPSPERPVRLMYQVAAGNVLFDHNTHAAPSGYALACRDCHHNLEEGETEGVVSCSECHPNESEDNDIPKRSDAFHQQCIGCHEQFGAGPGEGPEGCSICHVR